MARKLTKGQLKKHLAALDQKELIEEIANLFSRFKEVKQYYQLIHGPQEDRQLLREEYKKKLKEKFYAKYGLPRFPKATTLKKLVTEFKQLSTVKHDIIELTLYQVELSILFLSKYKQMDDAFYKATLTAYNDAIKMIGKENLQQEFKENTLSLLNLSSKVSSIFYDTIQHSYLSVYKDFE